MNARWRIVWSAALVALLWTAASCAAQVETDAKAPPFSGLLGVDGKEHGLADYAKAKAVVLVFTCNHCPVAKAYEDRLIALQEDYKEKGAQVIAINSNSPKIVPQDGYEAMKARAAGEDLGDWRAEKKPFNFPYLVDATQEVAKAYKATCTPHVFVLDADRKVAYRGAIDDNMAADKATKHYLRDAIDAVLAGRPPLLPVTKEFGCTIKWE